MADAGSSTSRSKQVRLSKEGAAFLIHYTRTVGLYPRKAEKEAILARLRGLPGNEAFTIEKLNSWFARHRNARAQIAVSSTEPAAVLVDDETILFPKLSPTHLQQLRVLYKKRGHPSEDIITFWADRINADRAEVAAWIQYQKVKAKESNIDVAPESPDIPLQQLMGDDSASISPIEPQRPRPHLPTPSKSLSPSPHVRLQSLPPIAVKTEDQMHLWKPPHLGPPTLEPRLNPMPQAPILMSPISPPVRASRHLNASLDAAVWDGLRSDATTGAPPKTAEEFAEKFKDVKSFLQKYDTGQLVQLGWDPSAGAPVS